MRVMFVTCPILSHTYPMVPLAWALRLTGHEVLFATGGAALAVAQGGLPVVDTAPAFVLGETLVHSGTEEEPPGARDNPIVRLNLAMAERLADLVRTWRPDLVMYDPLAPVAALLAAEHGIPVLRHNIAVADLTGLLGNLPELVGGQVGLPVPAGLAPIITFAPPSLVGERRGDWLVRAVPYNGGQVVPDWLRTPPQRPAVVVTRGAMALPGEDSPAKSIVNMAADVDADFLLLPGAEDGLDERALPGNVRKLEWTALSVLLPWCAAVVHHGGAGTIIAALHFGVPQLIVPNVLDRSLNADMVDRRGVGIKADPGTVDAAMIRRLIGDEKLRAAVDEVRAEMAAMPAPLSLVPRLTALAGAAG